METEVFHNQGNRRTYTADTYIASRAERLAITIGKRRWDLQLFRTDPF